MSNEAQMSNPSPSPSPLREEEKGEGVFEIWFLAFEICVVL